MNDKEKDPATYIADNALELAIGRQVKLFRKKQGITVSELSRQAGLSAGMLSKVENGQTSPSLATLHSLSVALNVPVTSLFRMYEDTIEASFVPSGEGLKIERQGTRAGHQYQLLGYSSGQRTKLEPYIVTITEKSEVFPLFQHEGVEFIHILEGKVLYRHANRTYLMGAGDSLYFDSSNPHGPEELIELPIRLLTVIAGTND